MTQNPYAGEFDGDVYEAPPRTSVLAVTSLVLSLICCIPGLGLLGSLFGVGAIIGIGNSRGRVGGRGVAVAGITIGLLVTIAWIGLAVAVYRGIGTVSKLMYGNTNAFMASVENGDFDKARAIVSGPVVSASDEQFEAFRDKYRAAYGSFVSVPTKFWSEVLPAYIEIKPQMQPYSGRQNIVPVPAEFDSGRVLLLLIVDPQGNAGKAPQNALSIPLADIWVVLPDGTEARLMDIPGAAAGPGEGGGEASDRAEPDEDEPNDDGGP